MDSAATSCEPEDETDIAATPETDAATPEVTSETETSTTPETDAAAPESDTSEVLSEDPGDEAAPPAAQAPPKRDPIWAWCLVAFGTVLMVLASAAILGERILANRYQDSVKQEMLLAPDARAAAESRRHLTITGPLNFLLLGSDARADDPTNGQRSDTIIVLHIPASMDRAYLVSIPRDLRVRIPAFEPTGFRGSREKVNAAFHYGGGGVGGVQLLSQTLSDLLGVQFDGAAIIDFEGFSSVVDQFGGVDMCVDIRTESIHIGYDENGKFLAPRTGSEGAYRNPASTPKVYEPGCQHFEGWEALDYVRQRKTLPNGDYDRQRHQQQFLHAVLAQVKERGWMTNPLELDRVLRAVTGSLTIDVNGLPLDELAYALRDVDVAALAGVSVPSAPEMIGNTSYIIALSEAQLLYDALRTDTMDTWMESNSSWINRV
ncbi:MAG: LCP family protein [Dactylosporangium sp.]|nr:LCP family protein [Dactylosporangium sp.]NNJ61161.1 LCP family protein [Dactylosporangium sp.]